MITVLYSLTAIESPGTPDSRKMRVLLASGRSSLFPRYASAVCQLYTCGLLRLRVSSLDSPKVNLLPVHVLAWYEVERVKIRSKDARNVLLARLSDAFTVSIGVYT